MIFRGLNESPSNQPQRNAEINFNLWEDLANYGYLASKGEKNE